MNHTLARGSRKRLARGFYGIGRCLHITGLDRCAGLLDGRAHRARESAVASGTDDTLTVTLVCGRVICHRWALFFRLLGVGSASGIACRMNREGGGASANTRLLVVAAGAALVHCASALGLTSRGNHSNALRRRCRPSTRAGKAGEYERTASACQRGSRFRLARAHFSPLDSPNSPQKSARSFAPSAAPRSERRDRPPLPRSARSRSESARSLAPSPQRSARSRSERRVGEASSEFTSDEGGGACRPHKQNE